MKNNNFPYNKLLVLLFYAIGMAMVEGTIVVYLRALYYPAGFTLPLKFIPLNHYFVEVAREFATLVMLATVGWLSGDRFINRFAGFIFAFGVWDIFYYIFLKIILNWPAGLLDWDVLFLIPIAWLGPVLAPVLVSAAFIFASIFIWYFEARGVEIQVPLWYWLTEIGAAFIILVSFLTNTRSVLEQTLPANFSWALFLGGFIPGLIVLGFFIRINIGKLKEIGSFQ